MGYATRSGGLLHEAARNHSIRGVESGRDASYGYLEFLVSVSSSINRIRAVEIQRFAQGYPQRFQQLLSGGFLAIDSREFLNPSDPPTGVFFDNSCISHVHMVSLPNHRL